MSPRSAPRAPALRTILVVDDEPLIRWSIRESLKGQVHVRLACSAEEGLRALGRLKHVDAVLVDVRLPGLNGLEFVKQARSRRPGLKVFVMTAYDRETAPRQAFDVRADGFLPKPFATETLRDMLASHLRS